MRSTDDTLRERLGTLADTAGPLALDSGGVARRIRYRRRLSATGWAAGATVVALLAGFGAVRLLPAPGAAPADMESSAPATSPLRPDLDPRQRGFACGDVFLPVPATDTSRVTVTLASVTWADAGTGLDIELTVTSPRDITLWGSQDFANQVLYLDERDAIVGGGPFLRQPGDTRAYADDLMPDAIELTRDQPSGVAVNPHISFCPGYSWAVLGADAARYRVVVLFGQLGNEHYDKDIGRLILDRVSPWPGQPSIILTTPLSAAGPGG